MILKAIHSTFGSFLKDSTPPPAIGTPPRGPRPARPSCAPTALSAPLPLTPAPPGSLRSGSVAGTGGVGEWGLNVELHQVAASLPAARSVPSPP
jgi:hypothetical protein